MKKFQVVFILGGPGSGKGTQSSLIQEHFGFNHLSAGHLLRVELERKSSQYGSLIQTIINQGKIVPSFITIDLLKKQMESPHKKSHNFVIDGFPRNLQNYQSWQFLMKQYVNTPFILHLISTEQQMLKRLKLRHREDDTLETISKRFQTYHTFTLSVLQKMSKQSKIVNINADRSIEEIFGQIKPIFQDFLHV